MVLKLTSATLPMRLRLARNAGRTTTLKTPAADAEGMPSSVTRRSIELVPTSESAGVQAKRPFAGSMCAAGGAPGSRLKVIFCAGRSESEATAVKVSVVSARRVQLEGKESCGGEFTSLTKTEKALESLNGGVPLSVTITLT